MKNLYTTGDLSENVHGVGLVVETMTPMGEDAITKDGEFTAAYIKTWHEERKTYNPSKMLTDEEAQAVIADAYIINTGVESYNNDEGIAHYTAQRLAEIKARPAEYWEKKSEALSAREGTKITQTADDIKYLNIDIKKYDGTTFEQADINKSFDKNKGKALSKLSLDTNFQKK